jgi:hypothetical protein
MRPPARFRLLPIVLSCLAPFASARSEQRIHLQPQFVKGATRRYRIETSTSSNEHNVTPVVNPEGASEYKQSTSLVLRIDVLAVQAPTPSTKEAVRLRATFEAANSNSQANAYAPEAATLDDAVDKLKGQSFEFSVHPGNQLADIQGLSQIAQDRNVAARVLSWLHVLFAPVDIPARGIDIGQKWSNAREMTGLPLKGLMWRNESTYLRNEPCAASSGVQNGAAPGAQAECAILLTRFSILRHGSESSDSTPEPYLRNGLRTSGKWGGSGESLDAISLATGFLVSSTQTATQDMDYEIRSAASGSSIHHVGHTTTRTEITMLPNPRP